MVLAIEQYRAADTATNAANYANQAVTRAAEAGMVYTVATQSALVEAAERGAARVPLAWLSELRRAGTSTPRRSRRATSNRSLNESATSCASCRAA